MSGAREIGEKVAALCKQGKNHEAIEDYYAEDVVSVESVAGEGFPREMNGKEAVMGKNKWWSDNHEVHSTEVKGPFPHGDSRFALIFSFDVTFKPANNRMQMEEVGVYEVGNGKVTREEFYYNMG